MILRHSSPGDEQDDRERDGCAVAIKHRELISETIHTTWQCENNRAEQSHEATRVRERGILRPRSIRQVRRFVTAQAAVHNLFSRCRCLVRAQHYRDLRVRQFNEGSELEYRGGLYSLALALATNNFSEVSKKTWLKYLQLSLVSVNSPCSN